MKKILTAVLLFSISLLAQSNSELIDIGEGGVSGVSKNAQFVCGMNYPDPPFIWSESTGRISLGLIEGEAYSVSNSGIVVGRFRDSSLIINGTPVLRAGYWANNRWNAFEGIEGVPPLDENSFTHAYGINSEGTEAVGMVWHSNWTVEACYWSIPDTGIGLLGQTGSFNSRANAISNDGSIIAGWDGLSGGSDRRAFYWDPTPHFIGHLFPTDSIGECRGMNSDGSVIVGGSVWPFIWTETTGMQQVVADSTQYWGGDAIGVSDNGTIVGFVDPGGFNYQAFIKKSGWNDIVYLQEYITDSLGITGYTDWYFPFADAISADGNRIGITAYPPSGPAHALILTIDNTVPVELTSFTATSNGEAVILNWRTATENSNRGFSIERKSAESEYSEIGFVPGFGTTTEPKSYSYTDSKVSADKYTYHLKQIDFDGSYKYSSEVEVDISAPLLFSLEQNYPNPFNPSTKIFFSLAVDSKVNLKVFDILGQEVSTIYNNDLSAGIHNVTFNAGDLNSGIYFYRLQAMGVNGSNYVDVKKMILTK